METLLLEDGGDILLEDGGDILLEGVAPVPSPDTEGEPGMIDDLYGPDWLNVLTFGARGDGFTDSTIAIQAALGMGQNVYLPVGNYVVRQPLTITSGQSLIGAGPALTTVTQKNASAGGITGTDVSNVTLRGFTLAGTGSGTANGISMAPSVNDNIAYIGIADVEVTGFGNIGVHLDTPVVSSLRRVVSASNGGEGFQVSNGKGTPTSVLFDACHANANGSTGYELDSAAYCVLNACASDGNPAAYALYGCQGVTLNGCGAENFTSYGWVFDACTGCHLNGAVASNGKTVVVHVTDATVAQTITGLVETAPATGATASILTDTGTTAIIINPTVITAASYASGTAYSITSGGGTVHL